MLELTDIGYSECFATAVLASYMISFPCRICIIGFSFRDGFFRCKFQGYQVEDVTLSSHLYRAWPDCMELNTGLAIYWWQSLAVITTST